MCAAAGVFGLGQDGRVPCLIGHSWVTKLKNSGELPLEFEYIDLPGGTFRTVGNKLARSKVVGNVGYVFVILGGNDLDNARDLAEVNQVKDDCIEFTNQVRLTFPDSKIIFCQIEERFHPITLTIREDFKRKGNKFNKWLNLFDNKDKIFCLRGKGNFSLPIWYARDGVHLNEAGNMKLAGQILDYVREEKADRIVRLSLT